MPSPPQSLLRTQPGFVPSVTSPRIMSPRHVDSVYNMCVYIYICTYCIVNPYLSIRTPLFTCSWNDQWARLRTNCYPFDDVDLSNLFNLGEPLCTRWHVHLNSLEVSPTQTDCTDIPDVFGGCFVCLSGSKRDCKAEPAASYQLSPIKTIQVPRC